MRARVAPAALLDLLAVWTCSAPGWAPLLRGKMVGSQDGYFHLFRLLELDRAVRAGDVYPRWAPDFALGYGYPVFNYYAPLALYLALPWRLVGAGLIASLGLAQAATILLAGAGMYWLARHLFGRPAGLVAGCLYGTLPYLLADVYVRGAVAETLALALLPLAALGLRAAAVAPSARSVALGAVGVAALTLAHNITALVGLPVLGLFALVEARAAPDGWSARRLGALAAAGALGLALAAIYWLPALLERDYVRNELLTTIFYDFHNNFQRAADTVQHTMAVDYTYSAAGGVFFRAGLVQALAAVAGAAAGLWRLPARRATIAFLAFLTLAGLFLMTPGSARLWETFPLLAFVQFPWRLLSLVGLATTLLAAAAVAAARGRRAHWLVGGLVLAPWLLACFVGLRPGLLDLREDEVTVGALNRIELDRHLVGTTTSGEYLPRQVAGDLFALWREPLPAVDSPARVLSVESDGRGGLTAAIGGAGSLVLDQIAFPGWQTLAGGAELPERGLGERALLAVDHLPEGARSVTVAIGPTAIRVVSLGLSACALLLAAALLVGPRRRVAALAPVAATVAFALIWPATGAAAGGRFPAASFEGGPRLLGGREAGRGEVELYWTAETPIGRPLDVALRLLDERGEVVARRDKAPRYGLRPSETWRPGAVIRDVGDFALAAPLPAASYRLAVGLHDAAAYLAPTEGAVVRWSETCPCAGPAEGVGVVVATVAPPPPVPAPPPFLAADRPVALPSPRPAVDGRIELADLRVDVFRPEPSTTDRVLNALARRLPPLRRFAPAPTADGSALGGPGGVLATLDPGGTFVVVPTWRALADVDEDYAVSVQLVDNQQRLLAQDDEWPRRGFSPTSLWHTGQVTPDGYRVRVPVDGPPGAYAVALHLYRRADLKRLPWSGDPPGRDQVTLGRVKVRPAATDDPRPARALFGGAIELLGAAEPLDGATVKAGTTIHVRPTWRSQRPVDRDLTAFVHLANGDGKLVANGDAPPLGGRYPTSLWEPGEVIADDYAIAVPPDLRGPATLLIGLYWPDNGERLRTADGDAFALARMNVTP